jgi:hypothetical protein
MEVGVDLVDTDHTPTGYCAIGSGDIFPYFAMAGLAHFGVRGRHLSEAKLIACRVMGDAISVAAHGLGYPIQMVEVTKATSSAKAHVRRLTADDVRILQDKVGEWKALEADILSEFANPPLPQDPSSQASELSVSIEDAAVLEPADPA